MPRNKFKIYQEIFFPRGSVELTEFQNLLFQLGFCHAVVIDSGTFQFSQAQVYAFLPAALVYFSYLTHFAITSLVILLSKVFYFVVKSLYLKI